MPLWDRVAQFLALTPQQDLQTRDIELALPMGDLSDLETQLLAIRRRQATNRPWRAASIREAMGVPAIFGAVNLAANLVGSMSMKAFRGEVELLPDDRPRVIVRPDPFQIPREFYRGTTYNIASRGEADWWIAARDIDGLALSILNIPPHEVHIEENSRDLRYPIIRWRDRIIPNEDFRQLVYSREPGELRGVGPLQMCGAAISVAVESQEWAANTYADGGVPSIAIHSATELTLEEASEIKAQWADSPANVPRVVDPGIEEIQEFTQSAGSSMLQYRDFSNGEVARMFNYPGSVLDYAVAGSSLTYQNVGQEFEKLLKQALRPNFMEVIEQTMSDLLPRTTTARLNSDFLTMADIKTRWEVYGLAAAVVGADEAAGMARRFEGLAPGDVENAAVPFAPPQAVPASLPIQLRSQPAEFRCTGLHVKRMGGVSRLMTCGRLLSKDGSYVGFCPRCKKVYPDEAA